MPMFRMLTTFDLEPGTTIDEFRARLERLTRHLVELDLVESVGPVGRRQRHDVMDTDAERDHEFAFLMNFRDRAQCDRSVEYVYAGTEPADSIHRAVYQSIRDPVFSCWEDLE